MLEERCLLSAGYQQTNLVSDIPGLARRTDANLVNPWGVTVSPNGHVRVSDNGTGLSTDYVHNGTSLPQVVTIPPPAGSLPGTTATPTGNILNTTSDFVVSAQGKSRPSTFIFATEDGTLSGWNEHVDRANAIRKVDNSPSGAVYKGLALGSNSQGNFLFATDFHNGVIDVFNKNFQQVTLAGSFSDPMLPPPPIGSPGFAPFGIANIGGDLFVTYALQKPGQHDDQAGPGNGFIDVFDTNGHLLQRFASHGTLNSPWGMAVAPDNFGQFSHALLVGNFGDGRINAFNLGTGASLGQLADPAGQAITIDGLWGLAFGKGQGEGHGGTLFFAAGINDEADGLFGTLSPADQDHPGGHAASDSGGTGIADQAATFIPSRLPVAQAPSRAVPDSTAAPIHSTTGTGEQTIPMLTSPLTDAPLGGTVSKEVIDHAFGDFQASPNAQVVANNLADALVI
jgi:uncharacterized protein (TIGR03118 family)